MVDSVILDEDRRLHYESLRKIPPKAKDELWNYVATYFGDEQGRYFHIPRKAVMPGHQAPFDFFCDAYFQKLRKGLVIAPRSGLKTSMEALLGFMWSLHLPKCTTGLIAAIKPQTAQAYAKIRHFIYNEGFSPLIKDSLQSRTEFLNGSELACYVGTVTGVNSPHIFKLLVDEFDQIEPMEVVNEMQGMTRSSTDQIKQQTLYFSSWKKPDYLVTTYKNLLPIENVYHWGCFDVAKCVRKVDENGSILWPADCEYCKDIKNPLHGLSFYEQCKGVCKKSDGYLDVSWYAENFITLPLRTWISQYMSLAPDIEDAAFEWFDSSAITEEAAYDPNYPYFLGLDFGSRDPSVAVFCQYRNGTFYIFDVFWSQVTLGRVFAQGLADYIKQKYVKKPRFAWGDRRGGSAREEVSLALKMLIDVPHYYNAIEEGVDLINEFGLVGAIKMRPSQIPGDGLELTQKEFYGYRKTPKGNYLEGDNHSVDAFRYFLTAYVGTGAQRQADRRYRVGAYA